MQFIGLNPSTADETKDDPTIRRCIGFAKAWGFGALCMTNIFAFRQTDPELMKKAYEPIGETFFTKAGGSLLANDFHLVTIGRDAGMIICAWGKHGNFLNRGVDVQNLFKRAGISLHHFKKNSDGTPQHPLYMPAKQKPISFE